MEVSLGVVIFLVRVVVSHQEVYLLVILVIVVLLGQPDLLILGQNLGHVIVIGILVISQESSPIVE